MAGNGAAMPLRGFPFTFGIFLLLGIQPLADCRPNFRPIGRVVRSIRRVVPSLSGRRLHCIKPWVSTAGVDYKEDPRFIHFKSQALRNLSRRYPAQQTEALIRPLLKYGPQLEDRDFGFLIKSAGISGLLDLSSEILESALNHGKANTIMYNTAISSCRPGGHMEKALSLYQSMQDNSFEPDTATYVTLIGVCDVNADADGAASLLSEMQTRNIARDSSLYRGAISVFCRTNQWMSAKGLLDEMQENNILPEASMVNQVIDNCLKNASDPAISTAMKLLDFSSKNYKWDADSYSLAIAVEVKARNPMKAIEYFEETPRKNHRCYTAVLKAYNALPCAEVWETALSIFEEMELKHLKRTHVTYNLIIGILGNAGLWRKALNIFNGMGRSGLEPNLFNYVTVMSAIAKYGKWETSLRLMDQMESVGIKPQLRVYNTVIRALGRSKGESGKSTWEKALSVMAKMEKEGIKPSEISYIELIRMWAANGLWQRALNTLEDLKKDNHVHKDTGILVQSYNGALRSCFKAKQWEKASELLEKMDAERVNRNKYTYEFLVAGYSDNGQWSKAVQIIEGLRESGMNPTDSMLMNVVEALEKSGQKALATMYYEESLKM
mmetsp:Transcript_14093/g.21376  ORF Transcript_14093/g.21376 Transcript_14093/m.21376 type:complete len:609 (-) Transcript_14093:85-1911(-)